MTTTPAPAPKTPATPYDDELARIGPGMKDRFEAQRRHTLEMQRLGYRAALADLAPLHRQMVEALENAYSLVNAVRPTLTTLGDFDSRKVRTMEQLQSALDAARKAGL